MSQKYSIKNDVIDTLIPASFKGKPFFWQSTSLETGREKKALQTQGDDGNAPSQDLGKKQKIYTVTLKPIPLTPEGYQSLLFLLESEGAGDLQLPDHPVFLADVYSVNGENYKRAINDYVLTVDFLPSQPLVFPLTNNTLGSLRGLSASTRFILLNKAIDSIANFNLASTIGTLANVIDNVLYKFPNNNAYLKAITNVLDVIDTVKGLSKSYNGKQDSLSSSGSESNNNVLDRVLGGGSLVGVNTIGGVVGFFGGLYDDLSNSKFVDDNEALSVCLGLGLIEFSLDKSRPWNLVSNANSSSLNVLNKQLALLQYCNIAVTLSYRLQSDLDLVVNNIISLNENITQTGALNSIEISEFVSNTLDYLKNEKMADYRVSSAVVSDSDIWNITYSIFGNIDDSNLEIIKQINPNLDYGAMTGSINILVSNT